MDENYYVLNVKVRENLTDMRAVERMKAWDNFFESHQNYSKEEVLKARDEIENNIWQNNREIPAN